MKTPLQNSLSDRRAGLGEQLRQAYDGINGDALPESIMALVDQLAEKLEQKLDGAVQKPVQDAINGACEQA